MVLVLTMIRLYFVCRTEILSVSLGRLLGLLDHLYSINSAQPYDRRRQSPRATFRLSAEEDWQLNLK